nr:hypothetical protein [Flavobacterium covae]
MLIFSAVLTPKSAPKYYQTQHQTNGLFYLTQLQLDSLVQEAENITIETKLIDINLKEIKVSYKDSSETELTKKFYILNHEE